MAEKVGSIYVSLDLQKQGFDRGIKEAQGQSKTLESSFDGVSKSLQALALVAGASLLVVKGEINKALDASVKMENSLLGLSSVAEYTGFGMDAAQKAAKNLAKDGLMNVADASTGLKNLLQSGFSLPEATKLMENFKNTAAFGKQSALTFGQAVTSATEGVKNGNSILVDNAGVTKNLSRILQEAGFAETDLMNVKDDAGVRMALYNGLLKEGAPMVGDAAKLSETYAGQQAKLNTSIFNTRAAIGDALKPALASIIKKITPVVDRIKSWIQENPALVKSIALFTVALLGTVVVLGALAFLVGFVTTTILAVAAAIAVVAALAGALLVFFTRTEKGKEVFQKILKAMKEFWKVLVDKVKPIIEDISKAFKDELVPALKELYEKAAPVLIPILKTIGMILGVFIVAAIMSTLIIIKTLVWYLANVFAPVMGAIFTGIKWLWDNVLKPVWDALYWYVVNILIPVWKKIFEYAKVAWDGIWLAIQAAWGYIKFVFDLIWAYITNILIPVWKKIFEVAKDVFLTVTQKIKEFYNKAKEWFDKVKETITDVIHKIAEIRQKVIEAFSKAKDWLYDKGKDIVQGLINGAKSLLNRVKDIGRDIGKNILDGLNVLDFGSPSKVLEQRGVWTGEGFLGGVKKILPSIKESLGSFGDLRNRVTGRLGGMALAGGTPGSLPSRTVESSGGSYEINVTVETVYPESVSKQREIGLNVGQTIKDELISMNKDPGVFKDISGETNG